MPSSREINEALNVYVRPTSFPVGVLPLATVEDGPADLLKKAKSPVADLGQTMTICMAIGAVRRYGWTLLMRREDNPCPLGGIAMGFEPATDKFMDGSLFAGYTGRPAEALARDAECTARFDHGSHEALLIVPLHAGDFEPQVTIVYGNSALVMRLVQASVFFSGGHVASRASGVLDCSDLVVRPIQTDECQCILPCNGDRVFGMAQDHEMAFTMPKSKVDTVLRGLAETHKRGQRFPIPTFMRFTPDMPKQYKELLAYGRQEN